MAASSITNFALITQNKPPKFPHFTNHNPLTFYHRPKLLKRLHLSSKPTSILSVSACLPPPHGKSSSFLVEKVATVLLGLLILTGFVKSFERRRENDSEDEVMCVKLLEENPKSVEALKMVVNVKMRRGKTKEAVGYVERLIELLPNEMEWRLLQTLCYEMMGSLSKAKTLFNSILKQQPLLLRALHIPKLGAPGPIPTPHLTNGSQQLEAEQGDRVVSWHEDFATFKSTMKKMKSEQKDHYAAIQAMKFEMESSSREIEQMKIDLKKYRAYMQQMEMEERKKAAEDRLQLEEDMFQFLRRSIYFFAFLGLYAVK